MNKRLVGLAAVAALLGGYLVVENIGSFHGPAGDDASLPAGTAARSGTVKLNPLQALDPQSFTAIDERPLFNPSRQPRPAEQPVVVQQPPPEPPPVAEPPPAAPQGPGPEDYKLLGIAIGPDGRIAAVRIASSGEVVYVRKGEAVENWSVIDVGDRSVAIGTADNPVTYGMFAKADEGSAPAAGGGAAPPQQAQPLPLPLPLPMPVPQPPPQGLPGKPPLPEQHTVPPDTGG